MIQVNNLVKKYGDHLAVDHLSFEVKKGQIYGFLGPNGAGKSTTMNIITGYLGATQGTVTINGHDILEEAEAAKKCIGYLPELPPLYGDMTVYEYLVFAAELKKIKKEERYKQVEKVMEITGVDDVAGRLIKNLSKGYKQRVGLAQAILGFPEVIILDEPTVGLDPRQIIEIRDLIRELSARHTIILSSHILSEVSAICDHIMIIAKGKLVASDSPENLEKLMAGANKLELAIRGEKEALETVLESIDGITAYQISEDEEPGLLKVQLETEAQDDIREELFYGLAQARCPICRMSATTVSLEDIFLELTSQDGAEEAPGKTDVEDVDQVEESEVAADDSNT